MTDVCKKINVNGHDYIRSDLTKQEPFKNDKGLPYAILRCYRAGVVCGFAEPVGGEIVRVHRARQMYRWNSDFVLIDLATKGINKAEGCRFSVENARPVTLTDVCAIIECTTMAAEQLINHQAESHGAS